MCVIVLVDGEAQRPSSVMLEMMWDKNGDGGGAAWREPQEDGTNLVCWEKGLMKEAGLARMKELVTTLPIPYILHMRIATIGGVKQGMTHPFAIDQRGPNELKGKTDGFVLFHNGTHREWDKDAKALAISTGIAIPAGKWSDSRALAWMCSILGNGFMELLPEQKGLAFGPNHSDIFAGKDNWDKVKDPETQTEIWCSNSHFLSVGRSGAANQHYYTTAPYCQERSCSRKDLGSDGRCPNHSTLKALGPGPMEVGRTPVPFPPTPKDTDKPQGPILSLELARVALERGKIDKGFYKSAERTHERMKRGGKDGDRAKRQLIIAAAMPHFSGLQALTSH